jgi:hypothetical protein
VLAQSGRAPAARILAAALADLRSCRARPSADTTQAVLERETHVS